MKILALDTSTEACSAALLNDSHTSACFDLAPQKHSELILPMCEKLLTDAGISIAQLDAIAVTRGPGSFTGIRIGAGICQGLAIANDLPVIAISTLQVLAQTAWRKTGCNAVYCLIDARMDEVYSSAFQLHNNIMQAQGAEQLVTPEEVKINSTMAAAGTGWERYQDMLPPVKTDVIWPEAQDMLPIAEQFFQQGNYTDASQLELVYLRNDVARKAAR